MKKFDTEDLTMKKLLCSDDTIFEIPVNQRNYSWIKKEQVEQYWEDIKKTISIKEARHYLGVISLVKKEEVDIDINKYEVIDGQQRLVTALIFLAALRDIFFACGNLDRAIKIQEAYLSTNTTRKTYSKLIPCKIDKYTFNYIVNLKEESGNDIKIENTGIKLDKNSFRTLPEQFEEPVNENIINAYIFFFQELLNNFLKYDSEKGNEYLLDVLDTIAKLEIIEVISDSISNMFLYFDSLNHRGLQLSQMDIIRNNFFKVISDKFHNQIDFFGELWDTLLIKLDDYDCVKFLKYYLMCHNVQVYSSKDLPNKFDELFKQIDTSTEMMTEIRRILDYAQIYVKLFDKNGDFENGYLSNIKAINFLGQQACHSFLMDYYYNVTDLARRINIARYIENMTYRRIICGCSNKQLDGIFKSLIALRNKNNDIFEYDDKKIVNKINENTPSDDEFERIFKSRNWGKDNITYYTILSIENYLNSDKSKCISLNSVRKEFEIEYILGENYDSKLGDTTELSEENDKKYVSDISNILIVENDISLKVRDLDYKEKISDENYGKSSLILVKDIMNWSGDIINNLNARKKKLIEISKSIWHM